MKRYSLKPFSPSDLQVQAGFEVQKDFLHLTYLLQGDFSKVKIPSFEKISQKDNLWKSTCFECFALNPDHKSYIEFNFSPSGSWNIYSFKDYREPSDEKWFFDDLQIKTEKLKHSFALDAKIKSENISFLGFSLTAVVEAEDLSYWAIEHEAEHPDFHSLKGLSLL